LATLEDMEKRLWRRASLSIEARLGNLVAGSYTGDVETGMKEGSRNGASLLTELCEREPGGWGYFNVDPERYAK